MKPPEAIDSEIMRNISEVHLNDLKTIRALIVDFECDPIVLLDEAIARAEKGAE